MKASFLASLTLLSSFALPQVPQASQTAVAIDVLSGSGDLSAHAGTYAWSQSGGTHLILNSAGAMTATGSGGATYLWGAPLPSGTFTVSMGINPLGWTDYGGPGLFDAGGGHGAYAGFDGFGLRIWEFGPGKLVQSAVSSRFWGDAGSSQVSWSYDPSTRTMRAWLGDGSKVSASLVLTAQAWSRLGIHVDRAGGNLAAPTQFIGPLTVGGAALGVTGVLHTMVDEVDVRASSPDAAVGIAQTASYLGGGSEYSPGEPVGPQFGYEAYEATTLPSATYPTFAAGTLSVDTARQLGYMPSAYHVTTVGDRSAPGVYRVYVVRREAVAMPLPSAQAWVASLYAVPLALGRALNLGEYLAIDSGSKAASLGGKTIALNPMAWASFDAAKISLPTLYTTVKPTFSIPLDPAILSPQAIDSTLPVVLIGDSISQDGYTDPYISSTLANLLGHAAPTLVNKGASGRTTYSWTPSGPGSESGLLDGAISAANAAGSQVIEIMLGANDCKDVCRTSPDGYTLNISTIVNCCFAKVPTLRKIAIDPPPTPVIGADPGTSWNAVPGSAASLAASYYPALVKYGQSEPRVVIGSDVPRQQLTANPALLTDPLRIHPGPVSMAATIVGNERGRTIARAFGG